MTRDHFTAEFRMPPVAPQNGTLDDLFDLTDALGELGAMPSDAPTRPIEGTFLL